MDIKLTFLGATETVTGSKYLLTYQSKKILIDCGLFQGYKELRLKNWHNFPVNPTEIDAIILTHAHIDHSGYIPLLVKQGFRGKIYSTPGTKELCRILLPDSGHLQEEDANRANRYGYSKHKPALPLYTEEDARRSLDYFVTIDFRQEQPLADDFSFHFSPAGHIIGSSFVNIRAGSRRIFFTGDMGRPHDALMREPSVPESLDYLIVESTYGDRLHDLADPETEMAAVINETVEKGGSVVIPAFAVGRAQALLYYIYQLKKSHKIPDVPVFLDSPMAVNATQIFCHFLDEHRLSEAECKKICEVATYIKTPDESKFIDRIKTSKIIISASGMAEGGRILHHLKAYAPDPHSTILFAGYQAGGTRGARMLNGEKEIKIHGEYIPVRASIKKISSASAHADYEEILAWLGKVHHPPQKVFVTHGEVEAARSLKEKIEARYGWQCHIPTYQETDLLQ